MAINVTTPIIVRNIWEEEELYPEGNSIFACKKCFSFDIEKDAYDFLATQLSYYHKSFTNFSNYYLANTHVKTPKYNFIFLDFQCSKCGELHKAFFYCHFKEKYFPNREREFFLADLDRQSLHQTIDGLYNRNTCQIILKKFLIRWHILSSITYIVFPYLGNPYHKAEDRIELLNEFLAPLHPYKTLLITRGETISQIAKDIDEVNGKNTFDFIKKNGLLHPLLQHAKTKSGFHAKFYCGIGGNGVEVLAGSHNIHGGDSIENLMFKNYSRGQFFDRYLSPINYVPIPTKNKIEPTYALIFNRAQEPLIDNFTESTEELVSNYL